MSEHLNNPAESELGQNTIEKPSRTKAAFKRAYVSWLWVFIPMLGISGAAGGPSKDHIIMVGAAIATICSIVSIIYPTDRKIVYVPLSIILAIAILFVLSKIMVPQ
ncbi:MAG: hypothetical protein JXR18_02160 [Neptuniibacter sp.]